MDIEKRIAAGLEIRADDEGAGEFSGYAVTWDFVDSYRSKFKRGAFTKTLQERGNRIKVKYNHETLIGKVLEAREDEKGLFVRGKLNLNVQAAKDVYEFLRDSTLDGLSFAFRVVKDHYEKGVRVFDEVGLSEFGPVDDPASDEALVIDVRNDGRATDFDETLTDNQARRAFWTAFWALEETFDDIWWRDGNSDQDETLNLIDEALTAAHGALVEAARAYMNRFWSDGERSAPTGRADSPLAMSVRAWLADTTQTPDQVATSSVLTVAEINDLRAGKVIVDRSKLSVLPAEVQAAHNTARRAMVEQLCKELRSGLSPAEHQRVSALLSRSEPPNSTPDTQPDLDVILEQARQFRASLKQEETA